MMEIHPEVSNGTVDVNGIPSQTTTEVTTHLIVPAGQTIFIGGLMKHTLTENSAGVPVLGTLPGIGRLFSNREASNVNTETVVLITPYVVRDPGEDWNRVQRATVEAHDDVLREQQERLHLDVNERFPGTRLDLSRYPALRMSSRPLREASAPPSPAAGGVGGGYTLYLFHAWSQAEAERFLAARPADERLHYAPARQAGRVVMVYGRYPDSQAASAAAASLPQDLLALQPSVRRYDSLVAQVEPDDG
jgi:hypothetical protein